MNAVAAEFCIFLSKSITEEKKDPIHLSKISDQLSTCFMRASLPNTDAADSVVIVEPCCDAKNQDPSDPHHKHFTLIRVPLALVETLAARFTSDMEKNENLSNNLGSLTPGQTAWLAELALRSLWLDEKEFTRLLHLTDRAVHSDSLQVDSNPTISTLEQLGLIDEVVLRHHKAQRRVLWKETYSSLRLFPDFEAFRCYFGDSIGFYFAWMRTYSLLLLTPVIFGLVCSSISSCVQTLASAETLDQWSATSCALFCVRSLFTLVMIIWALVCTKLWTRQYASLVEAWSTNSIFEQIANDFAWLFKLIDQRPTFSGELRRSPVTGLMERHFPTRKRRLRYIFSCAVTIGCLLIASAVHVVLLNFEGYITELNSQFLFIPFIGRFTTHGAIFDPNGSGLMSYLPGVIHSLLVFVMNQILFYHIAYCLTEWENHSTQEEFDTALVIKRFLFESLDAYGCLAYLGFILSDRSALRSLLLTMLITDCFRRFLIECVIPFIVYRLRSWDIMQRIGKAKRDEEGDSDCLSRVKVNRERCADSYEPFDDYLEMTLQHGYLVLFAHVAPYLGASIAFVSVVLECHSDAIKMLWVTKRPKPRPLLRGHFIWLDLLAAQAWLSILSNAGLALCSLRDLDMNYSPALSFILIEHFLILVGLIIHFFIEDVPIHVRNARLAREYKRARLHTSGKKME